jgi:hypothetical protein
LHITNILKFNVLRPYEFVLLAEIELKRVPYRSKLVISRNFYTNNSLSGCSNNRSYFIFRFVYFPVADGKFKILMTFVPIMSGFNYIANPNKIM